MPSNDDYREELERLLRRIGVPADQIAIKVIELDEAKQSFLWRCEHRARSSRISAVVSQLHAFVDAAQRACSGREVSLPDKILPEIYDALTGRYPFSNVKVAPVNLETLKRPKAYAGLYRTAVIDASVTPHVVNAAMRQLPDQPHLVAVRTMPFPSAAAQEYFFGQFPEPEKLRERLENFIVDMPNEASVILRRVHDGVRRATRDPARENSGRRTLYDWAEPVPVARLAFDIIDLVLEPSATRPRTAVQEILAEIIDVLIGDQNSDCLRQDILGSMLTVWTALNQHLVVAERLSGILDGRPARADPPRQQRRRRLWSARHAAVMGSAAELLRRACMGDHHHGRQVGSNPRARRQRRGMVNAPKARATGLPVPTIDLAAAARGESDTQFFLNVARACKPWLQSR